MESELALHEVRPAVGPQPAVVFVHGVNGHWRDTWTHGQTGLFWPEALAHAAGCGAWSVQYDAHTNWGRSTMPLQERAVSLAELLHDSPALKGRDIAIVAHSFGGLVAKQMLRHMHDHDRHAELRRRIAGTAFVATPHTGADIASYGDYLRSLLGSTVTLEDLRSNAPLLTELADWYRRADVPPAHVVYETRPMRLGWFRRWLMVVDRASANPGLAGATVVPVDADHAEIARPASTSSRAFASVLGFVQQVFAVPAWLARYPRQAAAVCWRRSAGGGVEFLLVRTSGGRWTFPKGGIKARLGAAQSAEQEALEEAGVSGRLQPQPFTHYLHGKREFKHAAEENTTRLCVAAYLLEVRDEHAGAPERGREPGWFAPDAAKAQLVLDRPVAYREELVRVVDEALQRLG